MHNVLQIHVLPSSQNKWVSVRGSIGGGGGAPPEPVGVRRRRGRAPAGGGDPVEEAVDGEWLAAAG